MLLAQIPRCSPLQGIDRLEPVEALATALAPLARRERRDDSLHAAKFHDRAKRFEFGEAYPPSLRTLARCELEALGGRFETTEKVVEAFVSADQSLDAN